MQSRITVQLRLALFQFCCLSLPRAGTVGVHHHARIVPDSLGWRQTTDKQVHQPISHWMLQRTLNEVVGSYDYVTSRDNIYGLCGPGFGEGTAQVYRGWLFLSFRCLGLQRGDCKAGPWHRLKALSVTHPVVSVICWVASPFPFLMRQPLWSV